MKEITNKLDVKPIKLKPGRIEAWGCTTEQRIEDFKAGQTIMAFGGFQLASCHPTFVWFVGIRSELEFF